jgi:hypothetical protein
MNHVEQEWARTLTHYSAARKRLGGVIGTRKPLLTTGKLPRAGRKTYHKVRGGPFDRQTIPLTDGTTIRFSLNGYSGRYVCAEVGGRRWTGTSVWVSDN